MLQIVEPHHFLGASAAVASSIARIDVGILWRKLVTSLAMGFLRVEAASAINVLFRSHQLQMQWIAATTSATKMIQLKIWRNQAAKEFVAEPVGVNVLIGDTNDTVVTSISSLKGTGPKPAASIGLDVNLFLNTLGQSAQFDCSYHNPSVAERLRWGHSFRGQK